MVGTLALFLHKAANEGSLNFTEKNYALFCNDLNQTEIARLRGRQKNDKDTGSMICLYILVKNKRLVSFHPWCM